MKLPATFSWAKGGGAKGKSKNLVPSINLYPEDPFYASIFGKSLKWALAVGRHIVIVTELVVIGSFFSRFILDRQLSDLNSEIVQKQSIAESYGTLEDDFRSLQQRTKDITGILEDQGQFTVLESLATITPPEIRYTNIGYSNNALSLQGTSLSNEALSQLVDGLRRDPAFSVVSLGNIRSGDSRDPSIQFTISAQTTLGSPPTPEPTRSAPAREEEVEL